MLPFDRAVLAPLVDSAAARTRWFFQSARNQAPPGDADQRGVVIAVALAGLAAAACARTARRSRRGRER
jgi:hypothetical protein